MGTTIYKYVIGIGGVIVVLAGVYSYGTHRGYDSGYSSGVRAGKEALKPTMDALELQAEAAVRKLNIDTQTRNARIEELESSLAERSASLRVAQAQQNAKREKVITKYVATAGVSQASCGLDAPAVEAINELIETQIKGQP